MSVILSVLPFVRVVRQIDIGIGFRSNKEGPYVSIQLSAYVFPIEELSLMLAYYAKLILKLNSALMRETKRCRPTIFLKFQLMEATFIQHTNYKTNCARSSLSEMLRIISYLNILAKGNLSKRRVYLLSSFLSL